MVITVLKKFDFDYDFENDSLFLYDSKSKSKASIEMDDIIIDFNNKKEVSAIELLNASNFFSGMNFEGEETIDKNMLNNIKECKIDIIVKSNFLVIKLLLVFKSMRTLATPLIVPTIHEPSPAVAMV